MNKYIQITGCIVHTSNAAQMAITDSMFGHWIELGNPCIVNDVNFTFNSQGTYIQKVEGKEDVYIFMADRRTTKTPFDGRYVWLPISFEKGKPVI